MRRRDLWTHPTVVAMVLSCAALLAAAWGLGVPARAWLLLLIPVALAPFVEFGLHRFVLHAPLPARDGLRRRLQIDLHHAHHAEPRDVARLFWPAWALVPMAGSVGYFVFYEWMHFSHHDPAYQPRTRYGARMRRAHMHHHYYNASHWWGITNDLADVLFGTGGGEAYPKPPRGNPRSLR